MDLPYSLEAYFQESGCAGRDGKNAYAVMLYNDLDVEHLALQNKRSFPEMKEIRQVYGALGNYFQTIKPNYFVGIRTPWTLQSEEVWLKTHRSAGKTWMIGGIIIILSYFIFPVRASTIIMLVLIGIISILPIIQSYIFYKRMKS